MLNIKNLTHYELVANAFCVIDIAQPIKLLVPPDELLENVYEKFSELNITEDWCYIVRDHNHIYGYLTFDDEAFTFPITGTAKAKASPISPDMLAPSSLPLIELVPLFEKHYFFFVLSRNDITHVVSFQDLDKIPMKLSLFALFLELESKIINLISQNYNSIKNYLEYLSPQRIDKALNICKIKYKDVTPFRLLLCTTFIDKKEIVIRDPIFQKKFPFNSRREGNRFFKLIESVRNQIAHSDSILKYLDTPIIFKNFIAELQRLTSSKI